uniref:PH domain-containing protein n=1 Tax=Steinernema glaseri TaxID=37863 RepID=A0A1I7YR72_9BILA
MSEERVRTGWLLFYRKRFFSSKWKKCFAVLYGDSTLEWFAKENSKHPIDSVSLRELVPYICVGPLSNNICEIRPKLPEDMSIHQLVGIKANTHESQAHVHWFLFDSPEEVDQWFKDITRTIEESVEGTVDKNEDLVYGAAYQDPVFCARSSMKKRRYREEIEVDENGLYVSSVDGRRSQDSGIEEVMEENAKSA